MRQIRYKHFTLLYLSEFVEDYNFSAGASAMCLHIYFESRVWFERSSSLFGTIAVSRTGELIGVLLNFIYRKFYQIQFVQWLMNFVRNFGNFLNFKSVRSKIFSNLFALNIQLSRICFVMLSLVVCHVKRPKLVWMFTTVCDLVMANSLWYIPQKYKKYSFVFVTKTLLIFEEWWENRNHRL